MEEAVVQLGQRIVADLPPGVPLHAAIDALCARHEIGDADVRLRGTVRRVRLTADGGAAVEGPESAQLVLAEGQINADLGLTEISAVLAWTERGVPRMAAGTLETAESGGVRVQIDCFGAAQPTRTPVSRPTTTARAAELPPFRQPDPELTTPPPARPSSPPPSKSSRPSAVEPAARAPAPPARSEPTAAPTPPASGGWGAAVAASRAPPAMTSKAQGPGVTSNGAGPLDADPEAKPGDVLVHPQFGRCKVVGAAEGEKVKLRTATGRFIDLHLGYVKLSRLPDEDGVRIFRVTPSRR